MNPIDYQQKYESNLIENFVDILNRFVTEFVSGTRISFCCWKQVSLKKTWDS